MKPGSWVKIKKETSIHPSQPSPLSAWAGKKGLVIRELDERWLPFEIEVAVEGTRVNFALSEVVFLHL